MLVSHAYVTGPQAPWARRLWYTSLMEHLIHVTPLLGKLSVSQVALLRRDTWIFSPNFPQTYPQTELPEIYHHLQNPAGVYRGQAVKRNGDLMATIIHTFFESLEVALISPFLPKCNL